jgi:hypothetical protein
MIENLSAGRSLPKPSGHFVKVKDRKEHVKRLIGTYTAAMGLNKDEVEALTKGLHPALASFVKGIGPDVIVAEEVIKRSSFTFGDYTLTGWFPLVFLDMRASTSARSMLVKVVFHSFLAVLTGPKLWTAAVLHCCWNGINRAIPERASGPLLVSVCVEESVRLLLRLARMPPGLLGGTELVYKVASGDDLATRILPFFLHLLIDLSLLECEVGFLLVMAFYSGLCLHLLYNVCAVSGMGFSMMQFAPEILFELSERQSAFVNFIRGKGASIGKTKALIRRAEREVEPFNHKASTPLARLD